MDMPGKPRPTPYAYSLTPREVQVLQAVVRAGSCKGAARELGLASTTISDALKTIFTKMGVKKAMRMAVRAERAGLLAGVEV